MTSETAIVGTWYRQVCHRMSVFQNLVDKTQLNNMQPALLLQICLLVVLTYKLSML